MDNIRTIAVRDYLRDKRISYKERNGELIVKCFFNDCDADSKGGEAHLYINSDTGQFNCKKCGAKGNIFTLAEHFGDDKSVIIKDFKQHTSKKDFTSLVDTCHKNLPQEIRKYLNDRGITDEVIDKRMIGYGSFYKKNWMTIPIKDRSGKYIFFKLREDPDTGNDKRTYPKGFKAQIYDWDELKDNKGSLFICEGEFDRLLLISNGISAITSTHGVNTFPDEWIKDLKKIKIDKIYVAFDNDEPGQKASYKLLEKLKATGSNLFKITLPEEVGENGDITDYFIKCNGSKEKLLTEYCHEYPRKIDTSKFSPLKADDLAKVLDLTVKKDNENKVIVFLCMLLSFTEEDQFNISFNAPSSTGKSYIPLELASLFPIGNVVEVGYCSPTAFFHDHGNFDMDLEGYYVDLSKKILVFLDQPHTLLVEHLRPILSHDKKIINLKIAGRNQKYGLKTKNIKIIGYPSVVFCTVGLRIDEQEGTRFLLLSPEITQEKIREGVITSLKKDSNRKAYKKWVKQNPERQLLNDRIEAIKNVGIEDIIIKNADEVFDKFCANKKAFMPRHQRDIKRLTSLIKAFTLLNLWWRQIDGKTIYANEDDIAEGFKIWDKISVCQELNIPPYVWNIYRKVILPLYEEKNQDDGLFNKTKDGVLRKEIMQKHYEVFNKPITDWSLRQEVLTMLESAGLIYQEQDPDNKKRMLIFPTENVEADLNKYSE